MSGAAEAAASPLYVASSSTPASRALSVAAAYGASPVLVATIVYLTVPPATMAPLVSEVLVMVSAGTRTATVAAQPGSVPAGRWSRARRR